MQDLGSVMQNLFLVAHGLSGVVPGLRSHSVWATFSVACWILVP